MSIQIEDVKKQAVQLAAEAKAIGETIPRLVEKMGNRSPQELEAIHRSMVSGVSSLQALNGSLAASLVILDGNKTVNPPKLTERPK